VASEQPPAREPTLYIFSGLPGSGKSTLSKRLSTSVGAVYVRIDTIEQALRDLCSFEVEGEGYRLAYRIARDNLLVGTSVVADSCNPIELTRREWEQVARDAGARYVNIEVVCSDAREHRTRSEQRAAEVPGLSQPTWHEIEHREYDAWTVDRIVVDTAGRSVAECERELLAKLSVVEHAMHHGRENDPGDREDREAIAFTRRARLAGRSTLADEQALGGGWRRKARNPQFAGAGCRPSSGRSHCNRARLPVPPHRFSGAIRQPSPAAEGWEQRRALRTVAGSAICTVNPGSAGRDA
jgi:predicted kinase